MRRLEIPRALLAGLLVCTAATAAGAVSPWAVPAPGSCRPETPGAPMITDAPPFPLKEGDIVTAEQLTVLREYIPKLLWDYRDQFFFEGMSLEIGRCFADYSPPAFYKEATQRFSGQARLLENGGLDAYTAGQPFPPDTLPADDPQAGLKWAWNYEQRYQGAGFEAKFRISDIVGVYGRAEPFEGTIYKAQLAHRADLPKNGYRAKGAKNYSWVAGGKMLQPFNAREHAWRQFREVESSKVAVRSDELHAYIAQARRVRRLSSVNIEGLYFPSFSVGVQPISQVDAGVSDAGAGTTNPTTVTPKRSGWEGLDIKPQRSAWRVLGVQDVLTPINAAKPMYPVKTDRQFGTWGVSFASDRWDFRRAVVLEATYKSPRASDDQVSRVVLHLDLQTLAPLFYQSWDDRGEVVDVGVYLGRWSEEREDYPRWPDDPERPIRVIDPAGAAFANVSERVGWRRESWSAISTPKGGRDQRNKTSVAGLTKGH